MGLPELTSEQIEELCTIAEAARRHVLSKVSSKQVEALNICAEAEGSRPVRLMIDVDITLAPSAKESDVHELADEAVKNAFAQAEQHLRKTACISPT